MKSGSFPTNCRGLEAIRSSPGTSVANSGNRLLPNSFQVTRPRFAAGEYPGAKGPIEAARKLRTLLSAGIDHFIDPTEPGELIPYAEIAEKGARCLGPAVGYERCPIVHQCVPSGPEQMAGILDAIDTAMRDGKTVYLHCWGGVGRTGNVVGCSLVRHGHTGDAAHRQIAEWWQGVERSTGSPSRPKRANNMSTSATGLCRRQNR